MKVNLEWIIKQLQMIVKRAYTPFSNFKVACMIIANNQTFFGVNIENSSFPVTLCAERSAIASMVTSGHRKIDYVFVYFNTKNKSNSSCGMCRQNLLEFSHQKTKLFCIDNDSSYKQFSIDELLMNGFKKS